MADLEEPELLHLGLEALHEELGGKMVPFAGYLMPVQSPDGVLKEHLHTRAASCSAYGMTRRRTQLAWIPVTYSALDPRRT